MEVKLTRAWDKSKKLSNDYELIFSNIENTQNINYTLPEINTQYARFKIVAVDMFGYQSEVESGYFTINVSGGGDDGGAGELEELIICEKIHKEKRYEVKNAHSTWEKSVTLIGYKNTTSLADGLKQMWEWAQKQPTQHN